VSDSIMSEYRVHLVPGSPFARAVLATLEEKAASYRLLPLAAGAQRSPPHLARHPFGRVPVLEHGGLRVRETQAILRYLDRVLPEPPLTPTDAQRAARMDQLMNVNDWYLFQGVSNVIGFQRVVAPRLLGRKSADEAAITAVMPRAEQVMAALAHELGPQPFFAGAAVTLADLLLAPQLDFLSQTPEWIPLTRQHENLPQWLERMCARQSMLRTTWDQVEAMARAG
jgi:glutathione S-transferase